MNSDYTTQQTALNPQVQHLMEVVRLQAATIQPILQPAIIDEQSTLNYHLQGEMWGDLNLAPDLKVTEPHQVGPPVSFISDHTLYASHLNATTEHPYHMFEQQNVYPYMYPWHVYTCPPTYQHSHPPYSVPVFHSTEPPALPNTFTTHESPPVSPAREIFPSTISAHKVFDDSSNMGFVVQATLANPSVTSVSSTNNCRINMLRGSNKSIEEEHHILPIFDGTDPRGWILKTWKYFDFKCVIDAEKIKVAGLHFIGRACTWYKWFYQNRNEQVEWKKFLHDLLVRFDDSAVDLCYLVNPLSIEQQSSVKEYEVEFLQTKELAENVYNFVFTEDMLAHNFVKGLKEEIQETIDLGSLKTLQGAINWAKFQESQIEEILLFEAIEEEYEMYEGMKRMFNENCSSGKAAKERIEDMGTTSVPNMIPVLFNTKQRNAKETNDPEMETEIVCVDNVYAVLHSVENPVALEHEFLLAASPLPLSFSHGGDMSKLNVNQLINQPTPAINVYHLYKETCNTGEKKVFINDLEEGTFSVSCRTINKGNSEVKITAGDTPLRGEDFVNWVVNYSAQEFNRSNIGDANGFSDKNKVHLCRQYEVYYASLCDNHKFAQGRRKRAKMKECDDATDNEIIIKTIAKVANTLHTTSVPVTVSQGAEQNKVGDSDGIAIMKIMQEISNGANLLKPLHTQMRRNINVRGMEIKGRTAQLEVSPFIKRIKIWMYQFNIVNKCIRADFGGLATPLYGLNKKGQKPSVPVVKFLQVKSNSPGNYSACLDFSDAAIAEGLAVALLMCTSLNGKQPPQNKDRQRNCTIIAKSNMFPLLTIFRPQIPKLEQTENIESRKKSHISDHVGGIFTVFWAEISRGEENNKPVDKNLDKVAEQNPMPSKSRIEKTARLVDPEYGWKETDVSISCFLYQQQTAGSAGLKLNEFKLCYALVLPKAPVVKKMASAWYWSAITLVYDPGEVTVAK